MSLNLSVKAFASDADALSLIVDALKADSGTIHLIGADGMLHLAAATPGLPEALLKTIAVIPVGKGMAGLTVERREPVNACNIQTDNSGDVRPSALSSGLAGAIVVPIFRGAEVIGSLGVANRAERVFDGSEIDALLAAGRAIASRHPEAHAAPG